MQGLESLNQFKNFVSSIGGLGRFEDTYIVHAAEGETVVPMEVLDQNPLLKKRLFKSMIEMGIEPGRYIVGNELNSKNPVTGQPEFFLKKIVDRLKKAAGDIAGYAAPIAGAMYGPGVGAAVGAGLGAFKRENPGDPSQWAQMGMLGGGAGLAANLASGQGLLKGRGIQGAGGLGQFLTGSPERWISEGPRGGMDTKYIPETKGLFGYGGDWGLSGSRAADAFDKTTSIFKDVKSKDTKDDESGDFDLKKLAIMFGLGTAGLGFLIDKTTSDEDIRIDRNLINQAKQVDSYFANILEPATTDLSYASALTPYQAAEGGIMQLSNGGFLSINDLDDSQKEIYSGLIDMGYSDEEALKLILDPGPEFLKSPVLEKAHGGIMDLQDGGFSQGPGTGTSDSIPAMLSDGEFVMTAKAVRGAGGGDRREGARKMYEAMDRLEARA